MDYPHLFEEVSIGSCKLRNRIIMPLFPTKYATESRVNERMIAFYRERAKGGAAMIVLDCPCLDYPAMYKGKSELRIDEPSFIDGIKMLLRVIHEEGAKAFMHLDYPREQILDHEMPGAKKKGDIWVRRLTNSMPPDEARRIIALMARGAAFARETGYDGVEIQASYGGLIAELLSPLTNKRGDEFGGKIENRARFLTELIMMIKETTSGELPISVKLVCDEYADGGITIEDSKNIAKILEQAGADAILANAGNKDTKRITIPAHSAEPGSLVHLAYEIKKSVGIPVIAIGKINTPELAERIINEGKADLVAMARALIADPHLPLKASEERRDEIRGCIYCLEDCAKSGVPGIGRACTVNPFAGQEYKMKVSPAVKKKKVMIVGGGPSGMQAAILLKQRGHDVSLYERAGKLGGQFRYADRAPCKGEVRELLRYLNYMIEREGITVSLNTEVTTSYVMNENPDTVVIATGSFPRRPTIDGIDAPFVLDYISFYEKMPDPGRNVVIIGGGDIGCETADMLASYDRKVTVIEVLPDILTRMKTIAKEDLLLRMKQKNIVIMTDTEVVSIEDGRVRVKNSEGNESFIEADTVIYSIGTKPRNSLYDAIRERIAEVYLVGDAAEPGNAGHALRSAAKAALEV